MSATEITTPAGFTLLTLESEYHGQGQRYGEGDITVRLAVPEGTVVPTLSIFHGDWVYCWDELRSLPAETLYWNANKSEWIPLLSCAELNPPKFPLETQPEPEPDPLPFIDLGSAPAVPAPPGFEPFTFIDVGMAPVDELGAADPFEPYMDVDPPTADFADK